MKQSALGARKLPCLLCLPCFAVLLAGCHGAAESSAPAAQTPVAPVTSVSRVPLENKLQVAGEFLPYQEIELHARVAGYIRHIGVDIGDHVHTGEVLATLDVPELVAQVQGSDAGIRQAQEQITRARSEVARAQADYEALHTESVRLQQASAAQPGLIAQQELDDARAKDRAAAAAVDAARSSLQATQQQLGVSQAEHQRFSSMEDYSRITAPFSGTITWRYADTGALIQAGTSSGSIPVVKLAEVDKLRLRLPVPESLAGFVHIGDTASIQVQALDKTFSGKVTRDTGALDPSTRTMQVEIEVPNPAGQIKPGMYAQVTLAIQRSGNAISVPIQAVDQSGPQPFVLVVDPSHHVRKQPVQLGLSTANRAEVLSGLNDGDSVIATNLAAYQPGELVQPKAASITSYNAAEAR